VAKNSNPDPPHIPRVIFVTNSLSSGGAERILSRLVEASIGKIDPTFLIFQRKMTYKVHCDVFVSPYFNRSSVHSRIKSLLVQTISISRIVSRKKPDVILFTSVSIPFGLFLAITFMRHVRKCVFRDTVNHTEVLRYEPSILERMVSILEAIIATVVSNRGYVVAPAQSILDSLTSISHLPLRNTAVIHNFVDIEKVKELASEELEEWPTKPVVVNMARLESQKNHSLLLRAFAKMSSNVKAKLYIIGDGHLRQSLETLSSSLNISDDVVFAGLVANPFKYIARSKVFVLSSDYEGVPNSLIEAMALGIPVIATDSAGSKEVLGSPDPAGIIVKRDDVDGLSQAMFKLVVDESLHDMYSRLSTQRSEEFREGKSVARYLALFQRMSGRS
jgi:N-acetylgalactosamine-N,N'-diacetylbacillosaminyl-diphospho-undecaprenol 4-alpha-N-acetylgalactosaminyltransferase